MKSSKSAPCSNVPIHCPLCPLLDSGSPPTIWKYSVMYHLAECHTDPDSPPTKIPGQLVVDSWISAQEESWMGVDAEETARWRNKNEVPDTDGITEVIKSLKRD